MISTALFVILYCCLYCLICLLRFSCDLHGFAYLVRLFRFLYNLYGIIPLMCHLWFLCDIYDETEFIRCALSLYILHSAFNTIVSFLLQSTICVNCSWLTPLLKKRRTEFLLSSSSLRIESFSFSGHMTSSSFMLINSMLDFFKTESSSFFGRCKKAGNKRKTVAKEMAKDENYNLLV